MNVSDPIADMLTRIRNANMRKHETVDVPASKMKLAIADILVDEGYVEKYEIVENGKFKDIRLFLKYTADKSQRIITGLKKISKKTYGFGEDGALLKGRAVIGDTEYEFDKNGVLKRTIGKGQIEETTEAQTEAQTEIQSTAAAEEPVQAVETKTAAQTESAEAVTQVTTEAVTQTTTEAVTETTTVEEPETVTTTEKREEAAPEPQNVEESAAEAAAD